MKRVVRKISGKLKKPVHKTMALTLVFTMLLEMVPSHAFALTGGPSQPEVQGFTPVSTSDMVNVSSGSFTYNIPLLNVDGYPVNIAYSSGITMDQEASWVGLGWSLNPGVVNRNVRGIPDDFDGETVERDFNMAPNNTYGANFGFGGEIFGLNFLSLNFSIGAKYNTYTGVGADVSLNLAISAGNADKTQFTGSLGLSSSSDGGANIAPSLGLSQSVSGTDGSSVGLGLHVGCSYSSRQGLSNVSIGVSASLSQKNTDAGKGVIDDKTHKEGELGSQGASASFNLMMPTYTPQIQMSMNNLSITGNFKVGGELFGWTGTYNIGGYFSSQTLAQTVVQNPAYGYMHEEDGVTNPSAMLDFNREKDGAFTQYTPSLPLTNFTYDIFSASGQGMSGSYRAFRGDLGRVFDPFTTSTSSSYSLGFEIGSGDLFHAGGDFTAGSVNSYSGDWSDYDGSNQAAQNLSYTKSVPGNLLYEPVYFKEANEKSVNSDPSFFDKVGDYDPQRIHIDHPGDFDMVATSRYESGIPVTSANHRNARDIRNQSISYLTHGQVMAHEGYDDAATLGELYNGPSYHIGEVTTIGTDGKRYVYGIAAYNTDKEETTFAVGVPAGSGSGGTGQSADPQFGLVPYNTSVDNSTGNKEGTDNYYSNIKTPPYAHSYLLTSVLSPDYVDADNILGPSAGDLGTWTKFNYTKANYPNGFKWRIPVEAGMATFNEGLKSSANDDKANYLYGTKELWYLNSIETKNYVAVFYTSPRQDGFGVLGRDGGIDVSQPVSELDSIGLYTKPNYNAHAANSAVALSAIETVHFTYDYYLCPGVPNNSQYSGPTGTAGKLTLRSIYFTYQNSYKGRLSPYKFCYSKFNPSYKIAAYDRWGFYKPVPLNATSYGNKGVTDRDSLTPAEYPYVDQDKATEDLRVSAWTMTDITLPSGGDIHVDYESNDYAYVQDKPAMEMFTIDGSSAPSGSNSTTAATSSTFGLNLTLSSNGTPNYILGFNLQKDAHGNPITSPIGNPLSIYFNGIKYLYFRFLMEITPENYEYVSGYSKISGYGIDASDNSRGWVSLQGVDLDDDNPGPYNPIAKSALQFGRMNTPGLVWSQPNINTPGFEAVFKAFASAIGQFGSLGNLNGYIYNYPFPNGGAIACQQFVAGKSWIRLVDPAGKKLGSGARVKDIYTNDEWNGMAANSEKSFNYGQQYSYTLPDGSTSSGVASYEPQMGGDENPWKQPVFYDEAKLLAPDDTHYREEPFGESFFPSPGVTYSRVTVSNLKRTGVHRDATGTVVHTFYTTYDFPTITQRTDLYEQRDKSDPLSITSLLNIQSLDFMTASQGFVIENNDMNGKPKAQYVYQEDQTVPISSVSYYYQQTPYEGNSFRLNNTATVINADGSVNNNAEIGVFFDNVQDFRQSETDNNTFTVQGNVDAFVILAVPCVIPMFWPALSSETTRFRSASTTKVIQRFGILDSTVVTDLGSTVKTQNLAYDAQTGEVLLTKTANDYNDPIYNMTYPAYWYYDGMGQVYKNIGLTLQNVTFTSSGVYNIANAPSYFEPGDELILDGLHGRVWVTNVTANGITAEVENGTLVPAGNYNSLEIVRSGRRNMQTMDMAKITTLVNPINSLQSNSYQKVTQASAKVYTDSWRTYCGCFDEPGMQTDNPYVLGVKGDYHLKTSLLYLTQRDQSNFDNNTNTRRDGTFTSYNPFYSDSIGSWWTTPNNWTFTSTVTDFNPYGQEIEDKDALGRYSSATFGFNQTLPTAVAANAQYSEIGFDGFEDWGYDGCADNHFDMNRSAMTLDPTQSHTGRHSLLVGSTPVVIGGLMTACAPVNPCNISLCAMSQDQTDEYNLALQPSGGVAPYTFSYNVISGAANVAMQADGNLHLVSYNTTQPFQAVVGVTVKDSKGCKYETKVNLTENSVNTSSNGYSLLGVNTNCQPCNISLCYKALPDVDGHTIILSPTGGTAPYTIHYSITTGAHVTSTLSTSSLELDDQYDFDSFSANVTVTDANGCSYQTTVAATYTGLSAGGFSVTGASPCLTCNSTTSLCYFDGRYVNGHYVTITPSDGTAPYTIGCSILTGQHASFNVWNGHLIIKDPVSESFSAEITVLDETGCSYTTTMTGSGGEVFTVTGVGSKCNQSCDLTSCYTDVNINSNGNVGYQITFNPSNAVSPYTIYTPNIADPAVTISKPPAGNLVYTVNDNSTLNTGFDIIDANGCVSATLFTSSGGPVSPVVTTSGNTQPCCNISSCYTLTTAPPQVEMILTAKGGSGSYIFTVPPAVQSQVMINNNLLILPLSVWSSGINVTITDANNPSCNISEVASPNSGLASCCTFPLCYLTGSTESLTQVSHKTITVQPSGGTGPYAFTSQINSGTGTNADSPAGSVISYLPGNNVNFTVFAADANGCTSVVTVDVTNGTITTTLGTSAETGTSIGSIPMCQ